MISTRNYMKLGRSWVKWLGIHQHMLAIVRSSNYSLKQQRLCSYHCSRLSLFTDNSRTSTKLDMQPLKRYSSNYKLSEGEMHIDAVLRKKFPKADTIKVTDISGGCGDMYEIRIYSEEFEGVRVVQQHKLVTNALKEEVGKMHGLRIFTSTLE